MRTVVRYLSSGINQTPRCIDWFGDTVAYAAHTGVLLYNPKTGQVTGASSKIHKGRVTSVRWIQSPSLSKKILISTGSDSLAVVWNVCQEDVEGLCTLHCIATLEHNQSVSITDGYLANQEGGDKLIIVTSTGDSLFCWTVCPVTGEKDCIKAFNLPGAAFITSLAFMKISEGSHPLLLCGGHDCRIHIFTCDTLGYYFSVGVLNGHEDWVTSLDVMQEDNGGLLLASGSKDSSVRVWRFSVKEEGEEDVVPECSGLKTLRLRSVIFKVLSSSGALLTVSAILDTLLAGHEGLVSEVYWARNLMKDGKLHQPYRLLSCSKTLDRSIIIWEPEEGTETGGGIWLEAARLGDVGGNMEGYFACRFSPDGKRVLGCSYQGSLHMWENQNGSWEPCVVVGGHFKEVSDIAWDPEGRYLLTTSKDQTTRLHAPWKKPDGRAVWHEIGRPQVHGYDMACICSLERFKFASGAEEKVIRGFSAPANSIRNFGQITGDQVEENIETCDVGEGASVPSLGLSNKSVMMSDLAEGQQLQEGGREEVQAYFKPISLTAPPTEDQLMQNTLWPEAAKLYGHGHDIIALASTVDGSLLASSCRAAQEADANILLWDCKTWRQVDNLCKHRLTVTQMEFSPNNEYLLSVSRDRTWTIFKRENLENDAGTTYKLMDYSKNKDTTHSRVIWSCAWLSSSEHFITGSRDKTIAVWGLSGDEWTRQSVLNESDEVTAVAVTDFKNSEGETQCLVASGLVNGCINIRVYNSTDSTFSKEILQITHKHHGTVKRLKFRPVIDNHPLLASCGEDNRIHLHEVLL